MPVGSVDGVPFKIPITSTGGSGGAPSGSGGTKEAVVMYFFVSCGLYDC
jgi:hypothetical protein